MITGKMQSRLSMYESAVGEGAVYYLCALSGNRSVHHRPPPRRTAAPKPPPSQLSLQGLCLHLLSDCSRTSFANRDAAAIFRELERLYNNDLGGTTCDATKALYAPVRGRLCVGMVSHKNRVESALKNIAEEEERAHKEAEAARQRCEAEAVAEAIDEAEACMYERRRREAERLKARLDA